MRELGHCENNIEYHIAQVQILKWLQERIRDTPYIKVNTTTKCTLYKAKEHLSSVYKINAHILC